MTPQAITALQILAYGFLHQAQAEKAVALLEALDALRPGDPRTRLTLATAHLRQGAAARALQVLAHIATGDGSPPTADLLRAQALAMLGRHGEARIAMHTFLARQPTKAAVSHPTE